MSEGRSIEVKVDGKKGTVITDTKIGSLKIVWSEGTLRKRVRSVEVSFDDIRRSTPNGTSLNIGGMMVNFLEGSSFSALVEALSEYYEQFRGAIRGIYSAFMRCIEIYAALSAFRKAASENPLAAVMEFPEEEAQRLGVKRHSATSIEQAYLDALNHACAELSSITVTVPSSIAGDAGQVLDEMREVLSGLDSGSLSISSARERAAAIALEIDSLWRWPKE